MENIQLLIDLHQSAHRQGPGSEIATKQALALTGLDPSTPLQAADIGCGTGASTLVLAQALNAQITAVDFLPDFLQVLDERAALLGLSEQITTLACSMDDLPFEPESLDLIWSEGAIYNIGFEKGVRDWRRFLKPGRVLVASEITWITGERPAEIQAYWAGEYPEIDTASAKLRLLEQNGYTPVGYFILPEDCWLANYYRPMQARFAAFLEKHGNSPAAQVIVAAEKQEMALYEQYKDFYSYGVYAARKRGS